MFHGKKMPYRQGIVTVVPPNFPHAVYAAQNRQEWEYLHIIFINIFQCFGYLSDSTAFFIVRSNSYAKQAGMGISVYKSREDFGRILSGQSNVCKAYFGFGKPERAILYGRLLPLIGFHFLYQGHQLHRICRICRPVAGS